MTLLPSIASSAASIELFSAVLFALGFARRTAEREYALAALLSLFAGAHSACSILAAQPSSTWLHGAAVANPVGVVALAATTPLGAQFALRYRGSNLSQRTTVLLYMLAAACAAIDLDGSAPRAVLGATFISSAAMLVLAAQTYLAGRREALAIVMGATILLATATNDLGVAFGGLTTGYLVDAGLAALVASVMSTRSARFVAVAKELERRTQELRTRTRELGRSYEELRAAQEELVKKEQLAVVGELAAVIAHEVRNPLAIIANAVAGLRKQAISRDDHETLLAILDEETSRLNRLVTDLLRYARPVNVQRSDFSLADLLERTLSLVTKDRKTIRTDLRLEAHDGRVSGDANLLRQVFDNLVVNAVQAMGTGGTLTVCVRAATDEGVSGVAVDIIDTGEGMDTQVRSRARDPFFTTRPSGTGLGLAIVDRIVDAHGGRLSINSRSGEGTTVTVFLPHTQSGDLPAPRSWSGRPPADRRSATR